MFGLLLENQYGFIEMYQVIYYLLSGDLVYYLDLLLIGWLLDGVEVQVFDVVLCLVLVGVIGELYFGGDCFVCGYYCVFEFIVECFVEYFWCFGVRFYCIGDFGCIFGNGEIVWFGCVDIQVKVCGFCIELVEVELVIMCQVECQLGLCGVVVVVCECQGNDVFFVVFLFGEFEVVDFVELKQVLCSELLEYMVLVYFVWVDGFVFIFSGKCDDVVLCVLLLEYGMNIEYLVLCDDYECILVGFFGELLDCFWVGICDSFFDFGGILFSVMCFMLLIEKCYGVDLLMVVLIEMLIVEGLVECLWECLVVCVFDLLVLICVGGSCLLLFFVYLFGGYVFCYLLLVCVLLLDQLVYVLQVVGIGQGSMLLVVFEDIVVSYFVVICWVQLEGFYYFGGWLFGGFVVYEMVW